jgi:hypothetical protein
LEGLSVIAAIDLNRTMRQQAKQILPLRDYFEVPDSCGQLRSVGASASAESSNCPCNGKRSQKPSYERPEAEELGINYRLFG